MKAAGAALEGNLPRRAKREVGDPDLFACCSGQFA